MEREGGCLCGSVRYRATLTKPSIGACHCGMCRRWTGGALLTIESEVTWLADDTVATYPSSPWAERGFCRTCGSNLFYRMTVGPAKGMTLLTAGSLDDLDGLALDDGVVVAARRAQFEHARRQVYCSDMRRLRREDFSQRCAAQPRARSEIDYTNVGAQFHVFERL